MLIIFIFLQVMNDVSDSIHKVERHQQQLQSLTTGVDELQAWVDGTKQVLEARHAQSATSLDEQDSIIVDPTVSINATLRIIKG